MSTPKPILAAFLTLAAILTSPAIAAEKIYLVDISGSIQMVATGFGPKQIALTNSRLIKTLDPEASKYVVGIWMNGEKLNLVAVDKTVNPKEVRYIFASVERDTGIIVNGSKTVHGEASGNSTVNGDPINPSGSGLYTAKPATAPNTFKGAVQLSTAFASTGVIVGPAAILNIKFKTNGAVLNNVVVP